MSTLISIANGLFTAASTWGIGCEDNAALQLVKTIGVSSTTSTVYSSTFTISSGTTVTGVVLYGNRVTTTGTITVFLNNSTTDVKSVTISASDLPIYSTWAFFKFPTTFTSAVNTQIYRVGISASSAGNATF